MIPKGYSQKKLIKSIPIGKRFGALVVIDEFPREKRKDGSLKPIKYLCKCEKCGAKTAVLKSNLIRGNTTQCANCGRKRGKNFKGYLYLGERFGKLVIIDPYTNQNKIMCKCDCGKICFVKKYDLQSGNTKSCGCNYQSEHCKKLRKKAMDKYRLNGCYVPFLTMKLSSRNSSGVKGVCFDKRKKKYRAYISINKKQIRLGLYKTLKEAAFARKKAEERYYMPLIEEFYNK